MTPNDYLSHCAVILEYFTVTLFSVYSRPNSPQEHVVPDNLPCEASTSLLAKIVAISVTELPGSYRLYQRKDQALQ